MHDFHALKEPLRTGRIDFDAAAQFEQPIHRRVALALAGRQDDPRSVGSGDLAGLIRQLLRHESLRHGVDVSLDVMTGEGWPTRDEWARFGVDVTLELADNCRVMAREWSPDWIDGNLTDAATVRANRRAPPDSNILADPAIATDLGIETFRSPGQAAAFRAMALLPRGQTLVVGLPTGSGKSLVFQAAAIRSAQQNELSVIVVPTTALAIDQEVRMQNLLARAVPQQAAYPVAYHSGLSAEDKRAFRERLSRGQQSVVIASPEAIVGALRVTLQKAAEQGRIGWLTIDEAHIVGQWGDTFRPEFQFLSGSVANWRRTAPEGKQLRTLLLTATLTDDCIETLRALFSVDQADPDADGFHILVAPDLRAEPDYWVAAAPDETERQVRVEEAVRHLPRPLIVYTSKRDAAASLVQSLTRNLDLRRVALFRGADASTRSGFENLKRWNDGDLDIVVATSAFGLGMDNSDVRTVIHACIPETVDRFYQEVGRGGRDGNASLSLWIHTPNDRQVASGLARDRSIGLERGWERWDEMRTRAVHVRGLEDGWRVHLDSKPSDLSEENKANRAWNVRTLIMMARAGLISLGTPKLEFPDPEPDEPDDAYEQRCHVLLEEAFGTTVVIERTAITEEVWCQAISTTKHRTQERDNKDQGRLSRLITHDRPFNETFAETYTITLDARKIGPIAFPGQCPRTRTQQGYLGANREQARFAFSNRLLVELAGQVSVSGVRFAPQHWVTYAPSGSKRREKRAFKDRVNKFLQRLVHGGIVEIGLTAEWRQQVDIAALVRTAANGYVVVRDPKERDSQSLDGEPTELPLPRATLFPPQSSQGAEIESLLDLERPIHCIILPETVTDSLRPDRIYVATKHPHDRMAHLLETWSL